MDEQESIDVLFVGGGPASLAGAIKLKQLLNQRGRHDSVVVLDKAENLGQHNLSGAVFEPEVLDELVPNWMDRQEAFVTNMLGNRIARDEVFFLANRHSALRIPEIIMPTWMRHKGEYVISVCEMVRWLGSIASGLGVDLYSGFAAAEVITEGSSVRGVKLGDRGLNKKGERQSNYVPGDVLRAKVTVFGDGSMGLLSQDVIKRFGLGEGRNPQVYSLGVKEIIRLSDRNRIGAKRAIRTFGFPRHDVFGGGTLYSLEDKDVAVALILGLDWQYCNLDPQRELQVFKSHKMIGSLIDGGEVISYGAKTLPEGGFYSVPRLVVDGALIIGDAAGLTNVRKLKGLHYAMKSGMLAAEAICRALETQDFSAQRLSSYEDALRKSFIMKDIQGARNYRQVFAIAGSAGFAAGIPLSLIQRAIPVRLGSRPDYKALRRAKLSRNPEEGLRRSAAVSLSGTFHRENEPSHITIADSKECSHCREEYESYPCESFCPGEVYKFRDNELVLSPSNCLHCQTCRVKCPRQVIQWRVPEGGEGPRYKAM